MRRNHRTAALTAAILTGALFAAGCSSSSGGKKSTDDAAAAPAGKATTPRMTVAMITHAAPGDTFWDLVRKGAQAAAERLSFGEAVSRGVCAAPPAGVPNPADVVTELAKLDAELFVIVEQDLYPCAPEVPLPIAVNTREHLAGCELTGTRRPNLDR